jgi:hypothetical protein
MLCNLDAQSRANDVPGFNHVMKNNLGYKGNTEVSNLGPTNDTSHNYFTLPVTVTTDDFMTLDESLLTAPRQPNGDLPYIAFAQLVSSSDLVNAGTNTGFVFAGTAPDLGAFEYGVKPPPPLAINRVGGTNYLVATTNLALGSSQWPRVATNKFDVPGNYAITNPMTSSIPIDVPQRSNRIRLP